MNQSNSTAGNEDRARGDALDDNEDIFDFETDVSDSRVERNGAKSQKLELSQNCSPLNFHSNNKAITSDDSGKNIELQQNNILNNNLGADDVDPLTNIPEDDPEHVFEGFVLPKGRTSDNTKKKRLTIGDTEDIPDEPLDEEDIYDKFVPTDRTKVEDYERQFELEEKENHKLEDYIYEEPKKNASDDTIIHIKRPTGMYTPPENFAMVCRSIYRSSFPRVENFEFLKTLKLRAILCLIPEDYPPENIEFNKKNGIKFFQLGLSGNKEPFVKIKPELVTEALKIITNPENQPILIHCNRGKHRTGCIVGCVRKLQNWSLSMIFDEYRKFAYPKERPLDQQFIEMYDDSDIVSYAKKRHWLPLEW